LLAFADAKYWQQAWGQQNENYPRQTSTILMYVTAAPFAAAAGATS
jgi:hypothetical protein